MNEGGGVDHFEGGGGGEGGRSGQAEEVGGACDAHDGRSPFGAGGEDGVAHRFEDPVGVPDGYRLVQIPIDLGNQSCPVRSEVELRW